MGVKVAVIPRGMTQAPSNQNEIREEGESAAQGVLWGKSQTTEQDVCLG